MNNRIKVAIQKSGRLSQDSLCFLKESGIDIEPQKEELICHSDNFPLDLLLVRDDDIPGLVANGICDFGIIGTNVLREKSLQIGNNIQDTNEIVQYLNFAFCRLSICVPKSFSYKNLKCLKNCRIATSYPYLLSSYVKQNNLDIEMTILTGSVEIAPRLGIAEGICDLVSTGATLEANNLREVETIFKSQAALIKSTKPLDEEKQKISTLFRTKLQKLEYTKGM